MYTTSLGVQQYAFNSLLHLRVIQDKYISLYRELIVQLKAYLLAIRILSKDYLPTTLVPPNKLQDILAEVRRYPRVNDENLYPIYGGEKIIFMSNQYLCLNLNELKFKPTTYYMSVN